MNNDDSSQNKTPIKETPVKSPAPPKMPTKEQREGTEVTFNRGGTLNE